MAGTRKYKKYSDMTDDEQREWRIAQNAKLNAAQEKLMAGLDELLKSARWLEYLKFLGRFYQYSFGNVMLILLQNPSATLVGSFRFWKSLGRWPRKGTGLQIVAYWGAKKDANSKDGQEDETEDGQGQEGEGRARFGIGYVYDISDTDGAELPVITSLLCGDDAGLYRGLSDFAVRVLGLDVREAVSLGGANGCCVYGPDGKPARIEVLGENPVLQKAKTMAHEIAHALLHSAEEYSKHTIRSVNELEAESVAFVVLDHFGIDAGEYSFGYLATWSDGGSPDALKAMRDSGDRIGGAAKAMITWLMENTGQEMEPIPVEMGIDWPELANV